MAKKLTTEKFIEKARKIHGNKYDYSKVDYVDQKTKVCIMCPEHGEFWQLPGNHIHKTHPHGCPECSGKKQHTKETFIKRACEIHGDKYDYSKVEYTNLNTHVCIICPEHGEFWQLPSNHIHKTHPRGCPKCNGGVVLTQEEFLTKAHEIHGDKYDYSKVDYVNTNTKVCIICPKHGEFWQRPGAHLSGAGCPSCWEERKGQSLYSNTEEFIKKARKVHGDKYDYSKVDYERSRKKVCIICPKHGEFWQTPNDHLCGGGCHECSKIIIGQKHTLPTEEFIRRAREVHGDKYIYDKTDTFDRDEKGRVLITCPIHGDFRQTMANHLFGKGCHKCAAISKSEKHRLTQEEVIAKFREKHGDRFNYEKVHYLGMNRKVTITCPIHGDFKCTPVNHLRGTGACPKCNISQLELEVEKLLKDNGIEYIYNARSSSLNWLGSLSLDFYLPKYNIAIECQGIQHFKPIGYFGGVKGFEKRFEYDTRKRELCESNGLKLLYDFPYEVFVTLEDLLKEIINVQ